MKNTYNNHCIIYDNGISYQGNLKTPNVNLFVDWWQDFKKIIDNNYKYYLVGGFINKEITKDIDIIIVGKQNKNLYNILYEGMHLGYKKDILIDMMYVSSLEFPADYYKIRCFNNISSGQINNLKNKSYKGISIGGGLYKFEYEDVTKIKDYKGRSKYKNKYIEINKFINVEINRNKLL